MIELVVFPFSVFLLSLIYFDLTRLGYFGYSFLDIVEEMYSERRESFTAL